MDGASLHLALSQSLSLALQLDKEASMRYTYRNVITGIEFETNCECRGSDIVLLEPSTPIEKPKEKETPKKPVKRGAKK